MRRCKQNNKNFPFFSTFCKFQIHQVLEIKAKVWEFLIVLFSGSNSRFEIGYEKSLYTTLEIVTARVAGRVVGRCKTVNGSGTRSLQSIA